MGCDTRPVSGVLRREVLTFREERGKRQHCVGKRNLPKRKRAIIFKLDEKEGEERKREVRGKKKYLIWRTRSGEEGQKNGKRPHSKLEESKGN